jgi:hypothetical protein
MLTVTVAWTSQINDAIVGNWVDANHPEKQVTFFRQNGLYFAKSVANSPDQEQLVFKQLKWVPATQTYEGWLVIPKNQKEYAVAVRMVDASNFEFAIKGFFLSRTVHFKRVKS